MAIGDTLRLPAVTDLAGTRYVSDFISRDNLTTGPAHFVTRALNGGEKSFNPEGKYWTGHKAVADA